MAAKPILDTMQLVSAVYQANIDWLLSMPVGNHRNFIEDMLRGELAELKNRFAVRMELSGDGDAPITTKDRMYQLLSSGALGNRMRNWEGLKALLADDYRGNISMRAKRVGDPIRLYHVPFADVPARVEQSGVDPELIVFSESPPDEARTIQGEVMRNEPTIGGGLYLRYSTVKAPMRLAFEQENLHAWGAEARVLLRGYLDASDVEWIESLLEQYPGHIVEFSGFRVRVGVEHRRTVIWEVRHY